MKNIRIYTVVVCFLLLAACRESTFEQVDATLGKDFFPIEEGLTYLYEVDSVVYNQFNQSVDTFKSLLRLRYLFFYEDSTGNTVLKVEADNPEIPFNTPGNRSANALQLRNNRIINYTDSGQIVKLYFPLRNTNQWNAHQFNSREPNLIEIQNHNQPFTIDDEEYLITTTAIWNDFKTPVVDFTHYEVFARHVGLIYSENNYVLRLDGTVSGVKVVTKLKDKY